MPRLPGQTPPTPTPVAPPSTPSTSGGTIPPVSTSQSGATPVQPVSTPIASPATAKYKPTGNKNDIDCPYCQDKISPVDLLYQCDNEYCNKDYSPRDVSKREAYCECGEMLITRVCPKCKCKIAFQLYELKKLCTTITLVGLSRSGKTTFLRRLFPKLCNEFGYSYFQNETGNYLMSDYVELDQYNPGVTATDPTVVIPLFINSPGNSNKASYFTFFDIAGEHIQKTKMNAPSKCMLNSQNIIFLIDAEYLKDSFSKQNDVITQFANFIENHPLKRKKTFLQENRG